MKADRDALRTLAEARPDLAEKVRRGEMTPHDALVLAGPARRIRASPRGDPSPIPPDPEAAAEWLARRYRGGRLAALIEALQDHAKRPAGD